MKRIYKIFITGVNGFIGQALAKRLIAEGHEVYGLYEPGSTQKNKEVKPVYANLTNHKDIEFEILRMQPQIVIHLAAKTEVALSFENYLEVAEVNYVGTVNLAEANRKLNHSLEMFIFASTMETYGFHTPEEGAFTEDTKQRPRAPYAVAKLACEAYLRYMYFAYKFPFTAFRQTNTYGRYDNDFFVMERIISQMVAGKTIQLGEKTPIRNFLYIDDLIDLYVAAIENPNHAIGEFFVTGPDNAITIGDLVDKIKEIMGWEGVVHWGMRPIRPGEIFYLNSNGAKAKRLLGWEPKVTLEEGIKKPYNYGKNKSGG